MKYLLIAFIVLPLSIRGATLGVSYDSGTRNVLQTDLDYVGATGNFTTSLQRNGVNVVDAGLTLTMVGTANEITLSAGAQSLAANRTWTFSLPTALTFTGKTVTGGTYSSPTLTTPTIVSFANATHTHQNAAGGGTLTESALALTDVTTANASTTAHGFLKKLSNVATQYMDGTGNWSVPAGGGGGSAPVGTVVNTGASTIYAIPYYLDATGTNIAPSLLTTDGTFTNFYAGGFLINTLTVSNGVSFAGSMTLGGSLTVTNGPVQPSANDGAALGTTSLSWSDLFLASGAVINFNAGNVTITHAAGSLTVAGATTVSLGTSAAFTTGTIELGHATANTLAASAGDMTIEGNRIFRVGGADVPVADGGTGISSGTSGGILYYSASGTLASSAALAANALVVGGGAGAAPATVTTGAGNLTALALAANATGGFRTVGTQTKQINLQRPDYGDGIGAVPQTNAFNVSGLMHYTFTGGTAETNANWVVYEFDCPSDLDTTVAMTARFAFLSGGTDTSDYVFHITYAQNALGAAYSTGTTIATSPIVMTITPTTPASGDLQSTGAVTLTGWAAALTPGRAMQVRIAKPNDAQDDGARDVQLVITYGSTL